MSARPISTSTISFGLASLPVKLYSTGEASRKISFNWIDRDSGNRVRQQYVNPETGEVVDRIYFDKAYYRGPDKDGARAYRLLSQALREVGRVAIAKFATQGKQYLSWSWLGNSSSRRPWKIFGQRSTTTRCAKRCWS